MIAMTMIIDASCEPDYYEMDGVAFSTRPSVRWSFSVYILPSITLPDILLAMAPPFLKSVEEYEKLVDSVDTFLLDCDGVLYHGKQVVEGVRTVLNMLRKKGKAQRFELGAR